MGLFGLKDWDKPGPGIDENAPKPRGFFQFFILFGRKFWKYMGLNMLYILISIPQIAILYFVFLYHIAPLILPSVESFSESSLSWAANAIIFFLVTLWMALCGTGPTTAGYVYVLRNYSLEEHAWVWSDFREKIKENFWPGTIVFLLDAVILFLFGIAFRFYGTSVGGAFGLFLQAFIVICMCLYIIMHWYIYLLMIGYRVKIFQLYTNSFVLTMLALPKNAGMLLILGGFLVGYHLLATVFWPILAITPTLLFSFIIFAWVFFAWRIIQKNVKDPREVKKSEL